MESKKVLILEDLPHRREYITNLVQLIGFEAYPIQRGTDFLKDVHRQAPDLVLLNSFNNTGQLKAIAKIIESRKNKLPVLMIDHDNSLRDGAEICKNLNFATLPSTFKPTDLKRAILKLMNGSHDSGYGYLQGLIIGESAAMLQTKRNILRLSKSEVTVLITGESGTGKELVARAIHELSPRCKNPFIKVNSAALPSNLLESELFGFEKGAFTGAWQKKPGKFKLAHSGSLLLDEIGDIPLPLQAKLLQVLQDNELSALGSIENTKIDVRVFAATNADLAQMVSERCFRSDLFYRLNVVSVHLPPLRERQEDIRPLTNHFLEKHAQRYSKEKASLQERTWELFYQYSWPGNIRELENVIQSITVLGNEKTFWDKLNNGACSAVGPGEVGNGPPTRALTKFNSNGGSSRSLKEVAGEAVRKAETNAILNVLCHTRWNRKRAAELLGISYKALLNKIKEYEVTEQYRTMIRKEVISNEAN